jgi:hypothetical protein
MQRLFSPAAIVLLAFLPSVTYSEEKPRFELAAWIDHYDFAREYDTEKIEGLKQILDHAQEAGTTTIWWRTHSGGRLRYRSKVDRGYHDNSTIDKRIPVDCRDVWGWVRYGETPFDMLEEVVKLCKERGLRVGVHWPFEETHWAINNQGDFNFERPRYWGRAEDGRLTMKQCSIGYEEVVRHKLRLLDEMIERGTEILFIDFMRTQYDPKFEYVEPVKKAYKGGPWNRHAYSYVTKYLRRVRKRLDASGRKIELVAGIKNLNPAAKDTSHGFDWRGWIEEGLIDTLNVISVPWNDDAPFESTRAIYKDIVEICRDRCRVFVPVRQYKHYTRGMWHYERLTKKSQKEVALQLLQISHEVGADGIAFECLDYNNYGPETRQALKQAAEGPYRLKKSDP